jgi:hypothetical protein
MFSLKVINNAIITPFYVYRALNELHADNSVESACATLNTLYADLPKLDPHGASKMVDGAKTHQNKAKMQYCSSILVLVMLMIMDAHSKKDCLNNENLQNIYASIQFLTCTLIDRMNSSSNSNDARNSCVLAVLMWFHAVSF